MIFMLLNCLPGVLVRLVDDRLHVALGVDDADPVGPRVLLVLGRPEQDLHLQFQFLSGVVRFHGSNFNCSNAAWEDDSRVHSLQVPDLVS